GPRVVPPAREAVGEGPHGDIPHLVQRAMWREGHAEDHRPRPESHRSRQRRGHNVTASPSHMHDEDTQRDHGVVAPLRPENTPVWASLAPPAWPVVVTRDKHGTGQVTSRTPARVRARWLRGRG